MLQALAILFLAALALQEGKAESFFKKSEIDFWGTAAKRRPSVSRTISSHDIHESLFAEPVRMADGRYATYVPPREVLAFLEDPTRERARSYLGWQAARAGKIAAALEVLEAVKREEGQSELQPPKVEKPTLGKAPTTSEIRLTYFRQAG